VIFRERPGGRSTWSAGVGRVSRPSLAAVIGICQKDIKKVLAYSTVSQLGYMFIGARGGGPGRRPSST